MRVHPRPCKSARPPAPAGTALTMTARDDPGGVGLPHRYDSEDPVALACLVTTCATAACITLLLLLAVVRFFKGRTFNARIFSCHKDTSAWRDEDSRAFLILILGSFAVVGCVHWPGLAWPWQAACTSSISTSTSTCRRPWSAAPRAPRCPLRVLAADAVLLVRAPALAQPCARARN